MNKKLILASASPRRQELLAQIGLAFQVCPSRAEEVITTKDPAEAVLSLSCQKAEEVAKRQEESGGQEDCLILGADTVVACAGTILGKPENETHAAEMLRMLQNGTHQVFTGVTLLWWKDNGWQKQSFYEETRVTMYPVSDSEIRRYVAGKEPMDKAGAYGIQGKGAAFIRGIEGDYNNVVGLPVGRLYQELVRLEADGWQSMERGCAGQQAETKEAQGAGAPPLQEAEDLAYRAVIFDLDGTLADTLASITYCTNRTLASYGLPSFLPEDYRYFVGDGAAKLIERALKRCGGNAMERFDQVLASYMENFQEDCMYQVQPYPGIRELLTGLKEQGVRICVLSNKPHPNTVQVVEQLFGKGFFDVVQGQTPEIRKKPDPSGVFRILETLQLRPEEALYVGDSCVDMDTGKAAGTTTVGVLWGFRDREELEAHGADALIAEAAELSALLRKRKKKSGRVTHD